MSSGLAPGQGLSQAARRILPRPFFLRFEPLLADASYPCTMRRFCRQGFTRFRQGHARILHLFPPPDL